MNTAFDISKLNPAQRAAVEHIDGPTLVLAGAGSGKTRALTSKIAHLVSQGIKPWRILAVTFTNKAAREMASRVESSLGIPVEGLWIGTFHGICVRILRREAERWGLKRDFTIYDRDDQLSAVKKAMGEIGVTKDRLNPKHALQAIGNAKNDFLTPEQLDVKLTGPDAGLIVDIYKRYTRILKDAGAFDFDDLLAKPVELFGKHPDVLGEWQRRFEHILVDEYQDTNHTQYLLMKMLVGDYGHVTVVGDDDQSIYSWRGADISNILNFEKDYKDSKTVRLEQNYRSTGTILKAANAVVANNSRRKAKKLWTEFSEGDKITLLECMTDRDEAERIIAVINKERHDHNYSLNDFVILYRTNAQSRSFEDVLRRRGIPYLIIGGLRFYERKEIKDLLAYLRLAANPTDAVSFTRAINTPKRGLGDKSVEKIEQFALAQGINTMEAVARADEFMSGSQLSRMREFSALFADLEKERTERGLGAMAGKLVEALGYNAYLIAEFPDNAEERMDNVGELVAALEEYENPDDASDDLSAFLAEVSLMADVDNLEEGAEAVTLMTLHSAKGLEFPSVFIAGVERGLFPLPNTFDEPDMLEEERRLFYVGITRAEQRLHISYAESRARYGSFSGGASMLISELPEETVTYDRPRQEARRQAAPVRNQPIRKKMEFEDFSQEVPEANDSPFKVGMYVRHPKFGRGKITASKGNGENTILSIQFGGKTRKIMPQFVRLTPA